MSSLDNIFLSKIYFHFVSKYHRSLKCDGTLIPLPNFTIKFRQPILLLLRCTMFDFLRSHLFLNLKFHFPFQFQRNSSQTSPISPDQPISSPTYLILFSFALFITICLSIVPYPTSSMLSSTSTALRPPSPLMPN
jgi:hypothetical protein